MSPRHGCIRRKWAQYLKWCKGMFWSQEAPVESSQVLIWENVVTYKIHLSLINCTNVFLEPPGHDKDSERENDQIIHIGQYTSCNDYSSCVDYLLCITCIICIIFKITIYDSISSLILHIRKLRFEQVWWQPKVAELIKCQTRIKT